MTLSIIIPIFNEAENIPQVIESLRSWAQQHPDLDFEVIWVDDGSTDGSIKVLQDQDLLFMDYKILILSQNFGSHAALRAGIFQAHGDYISFLYADLQEGPDLIKRMLQQAKDEARDVVIASRQQSSGWFSRLYANIMQKWVTPTFPKNGFDVILFHKRVQQILNQQIEGNSSLFLQVLTLGFDQGYLTYHRKPRQKGQSKWRLSQKIKLFTDSLIAFSYVPIKYVTWVGGIMSLIGLLFMSYLILRKLIYDDLVQGWTMLVSVLILGFGVTNMSLGIIAEYLWRNLDATRQRPVFVIKDLIIKELINTKDN